MIAQTNKPSFRICLTLALLWVLGCVAYGLTDGKFETYIWQQSSSEYYRECGVEADQSPTREQTFCWAAKSAIASDFERFMHGDPIWHAIKFALLLPLTLLFLCAYWSDLRHGGRMLIQRYADWVRGSGEQA